MTPRVLLNADLGEDPHELARDEALAGVVDALNIACGGHAGDAGSMAHFAELAVSQGKLLSAHPSYPDRANFGRVRSDIAAAALEASLIEQIRALVRAASGGLIAWIKPHGALYHEAMRDTPTALALISAARAAAPLAAIVTQAGPVGEPLASLCREHGFAVIREAFADRRLDAQGRLLPRSDPSALITDPREAAEHVRSLKQSLQFGTLCVHADTPNGVALARAIRGDHR